jgi:hypothetical protein
MSNNLRNDLLEKVIVDDNLEYDFLSAQNIDFKKFPHAEKLYIVTQEDLMRIDLISHKVYGTPNFWWVVAQRNGIIDTTNDMYIGMNLYIPKITDLFAYLNNKKKRQTINVKDFSVRSL